MQDFDDIYGRAAERKGGEAALLALLPAETTDVQTLASTPNDRFLSAMTNAIFKAGFVWKVVEKKWPGFEAAFFNFDISHCAYMTPEELEALMANTAIIRNLIKVKTVQHNAQMIIEVANQHDGKFGAFIADWPMHDYVGLLAYLKKHGARLGGMSGQYFLRTMGKDGFILGRDGVAALMQAGVIDKQPNSKKTMQQIQQAYNVWQTETSLSFANISRILAYSIDAV